MTRELNPSSECQISMRRFRRAMIVTSVLFVAGQGTPCACGGGVRELVFTKYIGCGFG